MPISDCEQCRVFSGFDKTTLTQKPNNLISLFHFIFCSELGKGYTSMHNLEKGGLVRKQIV